MKHLWLQAAVYCGTACRRSNSMDRQAPMVLAIHRHHWQTLLPPRLSWTLQPVEQHEALRAAVWSDPGSMHCIQLSAAGIMQWPKRHQVLGDGGEPLHFAVVVDIWRAIESTFRQIETVLKFSIYQKNCKLITNFSKNIKKNLSSDFKQLDAYTRLLGLPNIWIHNDGCKVYLSQVLCL